MQADPAKQAREAGLHLHRFHGGLRLRHNKKMSCQDPVQRPPLPAQLRVPLLQHLGPVAECRVEPGQAVLKGELIGAATTPGSVAVHAPTSGWVEAVTDCPISHPSGQPGACVVLIPDGEDRWGTLPAALDWRACEAAALRERIHSSGIVGLGGAVFPTGRKTRAAGEAGIHTLILNGAECEPYISCDEMLMRERPGELVEGALILKRAVGAEKVIIAIEDQMGAVRSCLDAAVREQAADAVQVIRIPTIYPEGGERQLIEVLTGLQVPVGAHPHDLGLLCQNVATAVAVRAAVLLGRPLLERYVTVTGNGVRAPANLLALLGTPLEHLVEACGGYTEDAARLVIGGPMMGYALDTDTAPLVKAANCVLVMSAADIIPAQPEMPCINCGECARVCPATLLPQELHFHIRASQLADAEDIGLAACIECGCCDFVCPSHIPLVDWFRFGKGELRLAAAERALAEQSRQRYEARDARLARQKSERAERLARRKRKLRDEAGRKRQVEDAIRRAGGRGQDGSGEEGGEG